MRLVAPGDARPRLPGNYYMVFNRRYQRWVVMTWPKRRTKVSPVTQRQNDTFRQQMKLVRAACGEDRSAAEEIAKAKPFLYQDYLMAACYGSLYDPVRSGTIYERSVRVANTEVNALLNSISSVPGSMLVRGTDEWLAILPGNAGDVLTMNVADDTPVWAPASGGGGGAAALLFLDSDDHVYPPATTGSQALVTGIIPANALLSPKVQIRIDWMADYVSAQSGTKGIFLQVGAFNLSGVSNSGVNDILSGSCILSLTSSGKVRIAQNNIVTTGTFNGASATLADTSSFQRYQDSAIDVTQDIPVAIYGSRTAAGTNGPTARRLSIQSAAVP